MKYKIKYLKLKKLEKELINKGELPLDYMTHKSDLSINIKQSGGVSKNMLQSGNTKCKKCNNVNNTKYKYCNSCNKNDILNVDKLTDSPSMIDLNGKEYDIHNTLLNNIESNNQSGGSKCIGCNNTSCKFCNKYDILNVDKLTDSPSMINLNGKEYNINNVLFNKLQDGGYITETDTESENNNLYSVEGHQPDIQPKKIKLSELSNKQQIFNNMSSELSDFNETESVSLSILNSD